MTYYVKYKKTNEAYNAELNNLSDTQRLGHLVVKYSTINAE